MNSNNEVNIEFLTRTSFIILIFKVIVLEIVLGTSYFLFLTGLELVDSELTLSRISVFVAFQIVQTIASIVIFLRWFYLCYEINEKEIICHRGIIAKNTDYYSLENVESVKLRQGIIGALCKFGTLNITIHHNDYRDVVVIKNISRPRRQIKIIEKNLKDFDN